MTRAPRVLVSGACLGQPAGGVRRHNAELLPRLESLLRQAGGGLAVVEGRTPVGWDLPPQVVRVPSDVPYQPALMRALKEGRALRRVLCVSDAVRARIVEEFPSAASRLDLIGNGEDHLSLLPRTPSTSPFMLHVGHVEPRKNLALIIEAMSRYPALPRLVLAGASKGDAAARLLAVAEHRGLAGKIEMLGPVADEELARLYSTAACAVFPSVLEGFGIGPAEALRAGCPVAASAIPAHLEVSGDGATFFSPADPDDFARAVMECVAVSAISRPPGNEHRWEDCAGRWFEALMRASLDAHG